MENQNQTPIWNYSDAGAVKLREMAENPSVYLDFLKFQGRMFKYNANAALEFFAQKPDAQFIAAREQWERDGCHVKPEGRAVSFMDKNGNMASFYDFSQVIGKPPHRWTIHAQNVTSIKNALGIPESSSLISTAVRAAMQSSQITACMEALHVPPQAFRKFSSGFASAVQCMIAGRLEVGGNQFGVHPDNTMFRELKTDAERLGFLSFASDVARGILLQIERAALNLKAVDQLQEIHAGDRGGMGDDPGSGMATGDGLPRRQQDNAGESLSSGDESLKAKLNSVFSAENSETSTDPADVFVLDKDTAQLVNLTQEIKQSEKLVTELVRGGKYAEGLMAVQEVEECRRRAAALKEKIQAGAVTEKDVQVLRSIQPLRKSVQNLLEHEAAQTVKFEALLRAEMGEKSPYEMRRSDNAWINDETKMASVINVSKRAIVSGKLHDIRRNNTIVRGTFINEDTKFNIIFGKKSIGEVIAKAIQDDKRSIPVETRVAALYQMQELVEKSICFDCQVSEYNTSNSKHKSPNTLFMHEMYSVVRYDNDYYLARLSMEEFYTTDKENRFNGTSNRIYNIRDMKITPIEANRIFSPAVATKNDNEDTSIGVTTISISQLYTLVKTYDKNFFENPDAPGREAREAELYLHAEYLDAVQTALTGVPVTTETDKQVERIAESRSITMDEAREVIKRIVDTNSSFAAGDSTDDSASDDSFSEKVHAAFAEIAGHHKYTARQQKFMEHLEKFVIKHHVTEDLIGEMAELPAFKNYYGNRKSLNCSVFGGRLDSLEHELTNAIHSQLVEEKVDTSSNFLERIEPNALYQEQTNDTALTSAQEQKIYRNNDENTKFSKSIQEYLHGDFGTQNIIRIGTTPYSLRIVGAKAIPVILPQSVLKNSLSSGKVSKNHTEGHNISSETLEHLPEALRKPILICRGNRPNTLAVICDIKDDSDRNLLVALSLDVQGAHSKVNKVTTIFGKKNIANFLKKEIDNNDVLAMHIQKAEELFSHIGIQSPKSATILCYDDSIAYSDKNVKRLSEISPENSAPKENVDTSSSFSEPESHMLQEGDVVTFPDRPDQWRVKALTSTQIDFENTNPDAINPSFSHIDFGADREYLQETLQYTLVSDADVLRQEQRAESSTNHDEKTFAEQVDASLNGELPFYTALKVCDTPLILEQVGCEQLPILYTQKHLRKAIAPKDDKEHTHGLTIDQIKLLPILLEHPIIIADSPNRLDSILVITKENDLEGNPVIASIKPNEKGRYEISEIDSNFITSVYGRNNFPRFLQKLIENDCVLYADKQKSQDLLERWGEQYSELTNSLDFDTIIHQSRNIVKRESEISPENSAPRENVDTNSSFSEPESHMLQEGAVVTFPDRPDQWRVKAVTSTQIDFENTNPDAINPSFSHIDFGADREYLQETLQYTLVSDADVLRQEQRAESSTNHDEKTFAEQVDDVLNGTMNQYESIKVCDTPQILIDIGCSQLPMLYTQRHLLDALHEKSENNSHYHGLTLEQLKNIPDRLAAPVILLDSASVQRAKNDSIIAVLSERDSDNAPIIVSILPDGNGIYHLERVDANFITSIYGKDRGFENFIKKAVEDDRILFWDKQKSQELFSFLRLQLPQAINNLDSNIIIHQSRNIVKRESEISPENSAPKENVDTNSSFAAGDSTDDSASDDSLQEGDAADAGEEAIVETAEEKSEREKLFSVDDDDYQSTPDDDNYIPRRM